mgnify:CR=1 FL=1
MGKGFMDFFRQQDADIFCLQETKLQEGQIELDMPGYYQYWNYAEKKGYSGTAVFTKKKPVNVMLGIGVEEHDREGRVITLEFDEFYFITVYTPNSQNELARLPYRMEWEDDFRGFVRKLDEKKPVIICGDMNVAKEEIDLTVRRVARIVKIGMFMDRYPAELSGGQQQRVAIARTLAPEPSVLFMDEPLSNLDAKLRLEMRYELQRLHVETGSTFVYVTHDQMEAMTLATQICLINNGVLQQYQPPLTVYNHPQIGRAHV